MSITTKEIVNNRLEQIEKEISKLQNERTNLFELLRRLDEKEIEIKIIKRLFPNMSDDMLAKYLVDLDGIILPDIESSETSRIIGPGNLKKMSKDVLAFLRERGGPTSIHDIAKFLEERFGYRVTTPSNSMKLMMGHESRIKRSHRKGFYEARG